MSVRIVGLGTWLPDDIRSNDAWPKRFGRAAHTVGDRTFNDIPPAEDEIAAAIVARDLEAESRDPFVGAISRHVAREETTSVHAEVMAGRVALAEAGIAAGNIDLVLSYAIVPERVSPSNASLVAATLGATGALAVGVDVACATAITQLEMAHAYLVSGLAKNVLVTQSHLLLRAIPFAHPAAPGLGDGASAMVVTLANEGGLEIIATHGVTHGEHACAVTWVRGQDDATDRPWWLAGGDFRPGSRDPARAKALMRDTVTFGARTLREVAEKARIDVERIGVIASVQPRGFVPHAIAERLGLPRHHAVTTYERVAHLGACGPVFNLVEARSRGLLKRDTIVAAYGQGAGFTRAAAIFRVH